MRSDTGCDTEVALDPVCAIHGKRWSEHDGGRCLYCCICFRSLTADECAIDSSGQKWDVCKGDCAREVGIASDITAPSAGQP